jgi:hypothetical protein
VTVTTTLPPAPALGDHPIFRVHRGIARAAAAGAAAARPWFRTHRRSIILLGLILVACGLVHGINLDGWPGRVNDDEGTYTAQAYAMQKWGHITHYTYWYDHPFGGWLLIAIYTTLTDGFARSPTAVTAARECMLWVHLASCVLLYMLGRRLGMRRTFAGLAVLLFSVSPLALWYQRMAFLDNIAVLWVLAALVCAVSPRRSIGAAIAAGVYMAFAFWSKETSLVLLPGVYLLLWQNRDRRNWRFARRSFLGFLTCVCAIYLLYAATKNELFEGPGHVSLWWAIKWQLFNRPPSGSLFDPHSGTRGIAGAWLGIDPYLVSAGVCAALPLLLVRRLRPIAILLVMQVVFMFRNGYMPYAYVTALLPFAALCIAGGLDVVLPGRLQRRPGRPAATTDPVPGTDITVPAQRPADTLPARRRRATAVPEQGPAAMPPAAIAVGLAVDDERRRPGAIAVAAVRALAVALVVALGLITIPPNWQPKLHRALTANDSKPGYEATRWFIDHLPKRQVILTDDYIWTDLVEAGMDPIPIWFYKIDLDPAIKARAPHGWSDVDYIILGNLADSTMNDLPIVAEAIRHSTIVARFGNGVIAIRKVIPPPCSPATPRGAKCTLTAAGARAG